jgi:hypothetical protein
VEKIRAFNIALALFPALIFVPKTGLPDTPLRYGRDKLLIQSEWIKKILTEKVRIENCAQDWTRTSTHVVHHPLKMACLPISALGLTKENLQLS